MKIVTRNINTSPFFESLGIPGYYYARCRLMAFLCKNASTFSADERKLAFCRRNLEDETKIERHFLSAAKLHASSVKKAGLQSPTATSSSDENGLFGCTNMQNIYLCEYHTKRAFLVTDNHVFNGLLGRSPHLHRSLRSLAALRSALLR